MAALMSCTSLCVFFCISYNVAFGGRSVTLLMDHGPMSHPAAMQDEGEDEANVRALCCQKRSTMRSCGVCQELYSDECIVFISGYMNNPH